MRERILEIIDQLNLQSQGAKKTAEMRDGEVHSSREVASGSEYSTSGDRLHSLTQAALSGELDQKLKTLLYELRVEVKTYPTPPQDVRPVTLVSVLIEGDEEPISFLIAEKTTALIPGITSISPRSNPLAQALLGHKAGDTVEYQIGTDNNSPKIPCQILSID